MSITESVNRVWLLTVSSYTGGSFSS